MSIADVRTMADIMAEQAVADAAGLDAQLTARPEFEVERRGLPQNPDSPDVSSWPASNADRPQPQPHVLTSNFSFDGPNLTATNALPPDSMGDIGPSQYFVALNGRMRVYDKATTAQQFDFTPNTFFSTVRNNFGTTDPRVRYDRLSGRWFIVYITIAVPNRVVLAMSNSGTITASTVWSYAFLSNTVTNGSGQPCLADYETLGIDNAALYMGVNQFCGASLSTASFFNTSGFVVNKANFIAGTPSATLFSPLIDATSGPVTPQGADNIDPASTTGYFVGTDAYLFGKMSFIRIATPGGVPAATKVDLTVPATQSPLNVPQSGGVRNLDVIGDRLINAVIRGGRLYTAHAIGVNQSGTTTAPRTRSGIRWYEFESLTSMPALRQSGTVFDIAAANPVFFWVPSINVNVLGDIVLGYAASSAVSFAGAAASHRRATDPLGTMNPPVTLVSGTASYNPPGDPNANYRWGDYSMVSVDPADDSTFWSAQMYATPGNLYTTRVINLTVTGGGGGSGPPSAPAAPTISGAGNDVVINWTPPSTGGAATSYAVLARVVPGGPLVANLPVGNVLALNVTAPSGTFIVSVQASNSSGTGPESPGTTFSVPIVPPAPGAPTGLAVVVNGSTGTFTWTNPTTGGALTGYLMVASSTSGGALIAQLAFPGPAVGVNVTNIPPGVYFVRLAGTNAGGTGPFSNEVTVNVAGPQVPGAPTLNPATVSAGIVGLSWIAGSTGGVATSYLITASLSPGGSVIASLPVGTTSINVPAPSGRYYVRVSGVNAVGTGPASNEIIVDVP